MNWLNTKLQNMDVMMDSFFKCFRLQDYIFLQNTEKL